MMNFNHNLKLRISILDLPHLRVFASLLCFFLPKTTFLHFFFCQIKPIIRSSLNPMSLTVYIHVKTDVEDKKSKIVIPKSWTNSKTVLDVIGLFAKSYNVKNPDNLIDIDQVHLETVDDEKIYSNKVCGTSLGDHNDYYIKPLPHLSVVKSEHKADLVGKQRCKNYGCNKYYTEEENIDDCCVYHSSPPVFHDTSKYWSCCSQHKAYDFESFQQIVGYFNILDHIIYAYK